MPLQVRYCGLDEIRARGALGRLLREAGSVEHDREGARKGHWSKVSYTMPYLIMYLLNEVHPKYETAARCTMRR